MDALTNQEREVVLSMVADAHDTWVVYADDPMWIARLDKIATAYKTSAIGKWYRLTAGQVTVKKERMEMTDEQREAAVERLANARANR